jgi:hypothetical protein
MLYRGGTADSRPAADGNRDSDIATEEADAIESAGRLANLCKRRCNRLPMPQRVVDRHTCGKKTEARSDNLAVNGDFAANMGAESAKIVHGLAFRSARSFGQQSVSPCVILFSHIQRGASTIILQNYKNNVSAKVARLNS